MLASLCWPREPRHFRRPGHRGPDAVVPVGGVGHPEPGAAEQDAPPDLARLHLLGHRMGVVGIVGGVGRVGAQVERL